jgi:hypothetical protein
VDIFGIDFTSAPSHRKPITCVHGTCEADRLIISNYLRFATFEQFDAWLQTPGPWLAAFDFPFGLPAILLTRLGWPPLWTEYVRVVERLGKERFRETLTVYSAQRPAGDKLHYRVADRLAGAISPMMMVRVPVGKMFFEGAPRLLRAQVCVLPCRPSADTRIALEGYPALVARRWLGKRSYKSDERKKQTEEQLVARRDLMTVLRSDALASVYHLQLIIGEQLAQQIVEEPMGDLLDALSCAIQAAWAYSERERNYGIAEGYEQEGWIADPSLLSPMTRE